LPDKTRKIMRLTGSMKINPPGIGDKVLSVFRLSNYAPLQRNCQLVYCKDTGYLIEGGIDIFKSLVKKNVRLIQPRHGRIVKENNELYMAKLKLDLHDICKNGSLIESELNRIIFDAVEKKIALVEIIPGKGSGQLKKAVLRFLNRPDIKKLYHRIEKDRDNFGRVFVHFKH